MRRYRIISEKVKQAGCWLLIIVLLPYIITVFINGPKVITASKADETMVKIKKNGKMPVEEYCIGVLARDMPADYEKEALNAQAVLIRTQIFLRRSAVQYFQFSVVKLKYFPYLLQRHAVGQQQAGAAMTKIMKPHLRHPVFCYVLRNDRTTAGSANIGIVGTENQDRKRTGRQRLTPLPACSKKSIT